MALIQTDFFSHSLMRTVTFNAVIPSDKFLFDGTRLTHKPYKTLYLLHGVFGNYTDWITGTRVQRWAQENNLAVIMPSGENKFYVDNPSSGDNGSLFIKELVEVTRDMFCLSEKKEDTFIAGLSMGGYGAITNGLKYPEYFSKIGGFSSALNQKEYLNYGQDDEMIIFRKYWIESVFGDVLKIEGSDKDPYYLAEKLAEKTKNLPEIFIACGTEDDLLKPNQEFASYLLSLGYDVTELWEKGDHEWDFWDMCIRVFIGWLDLDGKSTSLSSGNIKGV